MSWRDHLQPASFRGIGFEVFGVDSVVGRRTILHQYPQRDLPYVEDIGRKARQFTVRGFVIGDLYHVTRDLLLDAMETEGPGQLVHPYLGAMQVTVTEFDMTESSADGRMASFSMTCIEAGELRFPRFGFDLLTLVGDESDQFLETIQALHAAAYSTSGAGFILDGVTDFFNDAIDAIDTALIPFNAAISDAATFAVLFDALSELDLSDASAIAEGFESVLRLVVDVDALLTIADAFADDLPTPSATTTSLRQLEENNRASQRLLRRTCIILAANQSASTELTSQTEAEDLKVTIVDRLNTEAENSDDLTDSAYEDLVDLRGAVVRDLDNRGADLAELITYTPHGMTTTLAIAQRLYGDGSRSTEIEERNNIPHGGFVGPTPILVLSE